MSMSIDTETKEEYRERLRTALLNELSDQPDAIKAIYYETQDVKKSISTLNSEFYSLKGWFISNYSVDPASELVDMECFFSGFGEFANTADAKKTFEESISDELGTNDCYSHRDELEKPVSGEINQLRIELMQEHKKASQYIYEDYGKLQDQIFWLRCAIFILFIIILIK